MGPLHYVFVSCIFLFKFIEMIAWMIEKNPRKKDALAGLSQPSRQLGAWNSIDLLLAVPWTACGLIILHDARFETAFSLIIVFGGFCWVVNAILTIRWLQVSSSPSVDT